MTKHTTLIVPSAIWCLQTSKKEKGGGGYMGKQISYSSPQCLAKPLYIYIIYIYRVSQEEGSKLRESVPYVKIYRYNPKHQYPKLNGYGDNG